MSYTEFHMGKAKAISGDPLLFAKNQVKELKSYYENHLEQFLDEYEEKYFVHNDVLYEIIENKSLEDSDIFHAERKDDEISFIVRYYNGGCGFHEAIDLAMDKMQEKESTQ